jgi:hypothetical protein
MSITKIDNEKDRLTNKLLVKNLPQNKKALVLLSLIDDDVPEIEAKKILSVAKKLMK